MRIFARFLPFGLALAPAMALSTACGGDKPIAPPPRWSMASPSAAPVASGFTPADPLGPRPVLGPAPTFTPPTPTQFAGPKGTTVWLLEKKSLPLVAVHVVVPAGAAADPADRAGLANITADMLDEGAGKRSATDVARQAEQLGATLRTGAGADTSVASVGTLKKNLAPALELLADVIIRPRFDPKEWARVHDLWVNELKQRPKDPRGVMSVVTRAALYGKDHPYGHPVDGSLTSAEKTTLEDVKGFYKKQWRPDRATIVVVGDITRDELLPALEHAFGQWSAPQESAPESVVPPPPVAGGGTRFVLVDRADAPQAMIAWIRPGLQMADPTYPPLVRANIALGGSFTSRLNMDLREEHGWSYGAGSRVGAARGVGMTMASTSVVTEHAGDALKNMLRDIGDFAAKGVTQDEANKTRALARADVVEDYEVIDRTAARLAANAGLGLPIDYEAQAAARREGASKWDLDPLVARSFDGKEATVVIVGPKDKVTAQLKAAGLSEPELRDEEGNPLPPRK
jgi:predicted Zn-dependent peptidase